MEKLDPIKAAEAIGAKLSAELRKKIIIPQEKEDASKAAAEAVDVADKEETKKEKDASMENYFGAMKDYKPEANSVKPEEEKPEEAIKNEKLSELEKEVKIARKKYAGADFETNSTLAKIKKFLHISYDPNNKDEPNLKYSEYKNKLNDLFSLKVDELKSRNLEKDEIGKEMKDLVKYFDFDEKINLRNAYTESRAEAIEKKFGRVPGFVMNLSSKALSGYGNFSKKLGFTGKTALSYALIGSGLFGAVAVSRFLGSALIAKGVIGKSEVNLRERQRKASEARALEITRQLEASDKVYDDFVNMMQQQSVGDYKSVLENERKEGWKRIGKGLAAAGATFAVSKTLSHFMQDAWGPAKEHISEFLEKIGIHNVELPFGGGKSGGHGISFLDNTEISQEGHPLHGPFNELPDKNTEFTPLGEPVWEKPINLAVDDGGNLEKTMEADIAAEPEIETVMDDAKESEIETVPDNVAEPSAENLPNPEDSHFGRNVSYVLGDLDEHINENTSELSRPETHDAEEIAAFKEKIADLGYSRGFLENFRDSVFQGNAEEAAKSFRSAIALDEKWDDIKGMNFREAAKNMNWRASDKLDTIFKCLKETLGNDARPGGGETLEKWTERVSRLAIEKTK